MYIITTGVTIVTAELQLSLFANFKSHVVNREKHQIMEMPQIIRLSHGDPFPIWGAEF